MYLSVYFLVNPVTNPYSPGAGVPPPELAGRDPDIAEFESLLARAAAGRASQSLVLTGLRGVGKTVLLNDLARRARAADWIVAQVEARSKPVEPGHAGGAGVSPGDGRRRRRSGGQR